MKRNWGHSKQFMRRGAESVLTFLVFVALGVGATLADERHEATSSSEGALTALEEFSNKFSFFKLPQASSRSIPAMRTEMRKLYAISSCRNADQERVLQLQKILQHSEFYKSYHKRDPHEHIVYMTYREPFEGIKSSSMLKRNFTFFYGTPQRNERYDADLQRNDNYVIYHAAMKELFSLNSRSSQEQTAESILSVLDLLDEVHDNIIRDESLAKEFCDDRILSELSEELEEMQVAKAEPEETHDQAEADDEKEKEADMASQQVQPDQSANARQNRALVPKAAASPEANVVNGAREAIDEFMNTDFSSEAERRGAAMDLIAQRLQYEDFSDHLDGFLDVLNTVPENVMQQKRDRHDDVYKAVAYLIAGPEVRKNQDLRAANRAIGTSKNWKLYNLLKDRIAQAGLEASYGKDSEAKRLLREAFELPREQDLMAEAIALEKKPASAVDDPLSGLLALEAAERGKPLVIVKPDMSSEQEEEDDHFLDFLGIGSKGLKKRIDSGFFKAPVPIPLDKQDIPLGTSHLDKVPPNITIQVPEPEAPPVTAEMEGFEPSMSPELFEKIAEERKTLEASSEHQEKKAKKDFLARVAASVSQSEGDFFEEKARQSRKFETLRYRDSIEALTQVMACVDFSEVMVPIIRSLQRVEDWRFDLDHRTYSSKKWNRDSFNGYPGWALSRNGVSSDSEHREKLVELLQAVITARGENDPEALYNAARALHEKAVEAGMDCDESLAERAKGLLLDPKEIHKPSVSQEGGTAPSLPNTIKARLDALGLKGVNPLNPHSQTSIHGDFVVETFGSNDPAKLAQDNAQIFFPKFECSEELKKIRSCFHAQPYNMKFYVLGAGHDDSASRNIKRLIGKFDEGPFANVMAYAVRKILQQCQPYNPSNNSGFRSERIVNMRYPGEGREAPKMDTSHKVAVGRYNEFDSIALGTPYEKLPKTSHTVARGTTGGDGMRRFNARGKYVMEMMSNFLGENEYEDKKITRNDFFYLEMHADGGSGMGYMSTNSDWPHNFYTGGSFAKEHAETINEHLMKVFEKHTPNYKDHNVKTQSGVGSNAFNTSRSSETSANTAFPKGFMGILQEVLFMHKKLAEKIVEQRQTPGKFKVINVNRTEGGVTSQRGINISYPTKDGKTVRQRGYLYSDIEHELAMEMATAIAKTFECPGGGE